MTRVSLAPLSRREAEKLIRHALRTLVDVPPALVASIAELAQGVPLIIEETIHDLLDEGVIRVEGDTWRLDAPTSGRIRLPRTVELLLAGRVERLPGPLRQTLEAAAVAGRRFWRPQLEALLGEAYAPHSLADLERRGFVAPRREILVGGADDYGFVQLAMREAVYRMLPRGRREVLHLAAAGWLEAQAVGTATQLEDDVGYHYLRAGESTKALQYTVAAARRARRIFAIEEAVGHLQSCRRILAEVDDEALGPEERLRVAIDVEADLVELLALSGDLQGAVELADHLLAAGAKEPTARRRLVNVALRKAWVMMFLGRYADAQGAIGAAESLVQGAHEKLLTLQVATARAAIQAKVADAASAAGLIRQALKAHGDGADPDELAHLSDAYRTLGNCEVWQGRHTQARGAYDKAYELAVAANAPEMIVDALNGSAAQYYYQGQVEEAGRVWSEGLAIAERWDLLQHRVILMTNLAELLWSRGAHADAIALVERAERLGRFLGAAETLADACRIHAEALLATGRAAEAEPRALEALKHADAVGSPQILGYAHRTMAKVLRALIGTEHPTAAPRALAYHLGESARGFEAAGMTAEIEATRNLRALFLGGRR